MINKRAIKTNTAIAIITFVVFSVNGFSQQFEWQAGFFGFFDNREYFNEFIIPQTILGENIAAEAGFAISNNNRFRAGINYTYECGSKGDYLLPDVILYFKGDWKPATFYIGSFPRYNLISHPRAMLTDTLLYFRPMVEGMYLEHRRKWGYQNVWLDWTSRQTDTKRETFLVGASGLFNKGIFLYQHHFIMYHFAGPGIDIPGDHIRDNGGFNFMPGLNLTKMSGFDTLTVSSGFLMSYDRLRHVYELRFMWGWLSDVDINYKGFGLHGVYYRGDGQVLLYGDGFYKSTSYGRADLYYQRKYLDRIWGRLDFSFHFLPAHLDFSVALHIRASIDGNFSINKNRISE